MKTLTKKQREKIYSNAAVTAFNMSKDGFGYLCFILGQAVHQYINYQTNSGILPEFEMFKPERISDNDTWFDDVEENGERIICMLLCAEMCKP